MKIKVGVALVLPGVLGSVLPTTGWSILAAFGGPKWNAACHKLGVEKKLFVFTNPTNPNFSCRP